MILTLELPGRKQISPVLASVGGRALSTRPQTPWKHFYPPSIAEHDHTSLLQRDLARLTWLKEFQDVEAGNTRPLNRFATEFRANHGIELEG